MYICQIKIKKTRLLTFVKYIIYKCDCINGTSVYFKGHCVSAIVLPMRLDGLLTFWYNNKSKC